MQDFNKFCRLCLSQSDPLVSIFESSKNIPLELSTCLSIDITVEDLLPKNICHKCSNLMHSFYDFYINAKCCEQWLLTCLSNENTTNIDNVSNKCKSENLQTPCETEFLAEFLDSDNNSFDMELLTNDPSAFNALDYLTNENSNTANVNNKFGNSGIKLTKITNQKYAMCDVPDDSYEIHMEVDFLDSDWDIVNEIFSKQGKCNSITSSKLDAPDKIKNENYSCMSCKSIFNDFEILADHMGSCEALKRTCVDCGNLFETREKMLKHRAVHSLGEPSNCQHCQKSFNGYERLHQHVEKCHSDFVADSGWVYRCKECGEIFHSKDVLYKHAKSHVKSKDTLQLNKFLCTDCGDGYPSQRRLQNHRKLKHSKERKLGTCFYRCKVCAKIFSDRNQLYIHIKQHTNIMENTQHLCDSCGRSFNSYYALSRHVLTHVGKQFQCNICTRQFINGSILKKHLGTHEIDTQVCEMCGMIFANDILLNMHQNEMHDVKY